MSTNIVLSVKISRNLLTLLIIIVNAVLVFGGVLINSYVKDTTVSGAAYIFLSTVVNAVIIYLTTVKESIPEEKPEIK